ncbi:MAG TPA: hypothetical protein DDZ80_14140, partial [Cyanobacteria bacterium UBA8803]|nr:hypothetical protein [Cyanobacteria bacterium UBA8803]
QSPYGDLVSGKLDQLIYGSESQSLEFQSPYGDLVSGKPKDLKAMLGEGLFQSPYGDLVSGKDR